MKSKALKLVLASAALCMCAASYADIKPEDGQKFEPYAMTAGLMDGLAKTCLEQGDTLLTTVPEASKQLAVTLEHYGMPKEAFKSDYAQGQAQLASILANRSKSELCVPKALATLGNWSHAVDAVVAHLSELDSK